MERKAKPKGWLKNIARSVPAEKVATEAPAAPQENTERLTRHRTAGIFKKISQFLRVTAGPKVGESVHQERLAICRKCPNRQDGDNGQWCGVCGCGNRAAAELTSKLWWARLECPVGYFDAKEEA